MWIAPRLATSDVSIAARNIWSLIHVVFRSNPLQSTTELLSKLRPWTTRVKPGLPAGTCRGDTAVMTGASAARLGSATASNRITRDRRNREDFILHLMRVSQETEHSGSRPGAKTRVEPPGRLLLGFCPN